MINFKKLISLFYLFFLLLNFNWGQGNGVKNIEIERTEEKVHFVKIITSEGEIISFSHRHLFSDLKVVDAFIDSLYCVVIFKSDYDTYHFRAAYKEHENWHFDYLHGGVFNVGEFINLYRKVTLHDVRILNGTTIEVNYSRSNYGLLFEDSIKYPRTALFTIAKNGFYDKEFNQLIDYDNTVKKYPNSPREVVSLKKGAEY